MRRRRPLHTKARTKTRRERADQRREKARSVYIPARNMRKVMSAPVPKFRQGGCSIITSPECSDVSMSESCDAHEVEDGGRWWYELFQPVLCMLLQP